MGNTHKHLICLILGLFQFGTLARADVYGVSEESAIHDMRAQTIKLATAILVRDADWFTQNNRKLSDAYRFCSTPPFYSEQRTLGHCSGTLVGPDLILTAGHCVQSESDCESMSIAFDYIDPLSPESLKQRSDLKYRCQRMVIHRTPILGIISPDYALIQLDRNVVGRTPIELKSFNSSSDTIQAFGHPHGLPLKISTGYMSASRDKNPDKGFYYEASMLAAPGLSGAGIYNSAYELIGILVRGGAPYNTDDALPRSRCYIPIKCTANSCPWIHIQKLDSILETTEIGSKR